MSSNQTGAQLPIVDEDDSLSPNRMQQTNISSAAAQPNHTSRSRKLPFLDLVNGPREEYLKIGVPLYEASIRCDWKAAKPIFEKHKEMGLVRYSITENGETALHVAASAKNPRRVQEFVKNLMLLMENDDLALQNKSHNTALYLAAIAGNVEAVKIMLEKNRDLIKIPGGGGKMMPLYTAALFGQVKVVKYLYEKSRDLCTEDGWTTENRGWLLEKCVENDMFDIALKIARKPENLSPDNNATLLGIFARKRDAFSSKKLNFFVRIFNWVCACIGLMEGAHEKERRALELLKIVWKEIAKMPKDQIDRIIRGPADPIKQDNRSSSMRVSQAIQLERLISEHVSEMKVETKKIMGVQPPAADLTTKEKVDQALRLEQLISTHLVNMEVKTHNIIEGSTVTAKEDRVMELQKLISLHIVNMHVGAHNIIRGKSAFAKEIQAPHLQNMIDKHITDLKVETNKIVIKEPLVTTPSKTYSSRLLFIAAEMGNTKFLVELIRLYPDLIWKVNDNNQTIFHIAVKHRHRGVYNLLYEIGAMKDLITPLRDPHDNNMLHLVGKLAKKKRLEDVSGVALQMQRELLWFQEVKNMIPPSYRERENKDGLTPHELFTKEHKDLLTQGEKWMKGTANQCMVVATLIATIVFAAAFTVPGGYIQDNGQQDNGIPVFRSKATFMVFVVADAISLFASSASILMFLSILTSRYAERDFLSSLPQKLMFGLVFLFLSMTTMTVAFSVSFFVLYHKGLLWMPILIGSFALCAVILYMFLQFSLFFDVIRSTLGSRYLFKPRKHVLYYENPKV